MNIWVIGNGESRSKFKLSQINGYIIGCNAIHRDLDCNVFVAVDRKMVYEMLENPNLKSRLIYTRPEWYKEFNKYKNVHQLPDLPFEINTKADYGFHWNSGPYAIYLAASRRPKNINLLGFDLFSSNGNLNNIYKNTKNYGKESDKAIEPSFWIYQLGKLFEYYNEIEFIQHQEIHWQSPPEWSRFNNLTIKYFPV